MKKEYNNNLIFDNMDDVVERLWGIYSAEDKESAEKLAGKLRKDYNLLVRTFETSALLYYLRQKRYFKM